jgi:hypothetical protein
VSTERPPRRRPPPRRLRRGRLLAVFAVMFVVFLLGIAFGVALHDNPKTGGSTTFIRTFFPLSPKETVTVTTSPQ